MQRHAAKPNETIGHALGQRGDLFVLNCRACERQSRVLTVVEREHGRREYLNVNVIRVHVAQAQIDVPDFARHRVLDNLAVDSERGLRRAAALKDRRDFGGLFGEKAHRLFGEDVSMRVNDTNFSHHTPRHDDARSALDITSFSF